MKYDFIEIGTSDFETEIQSCNEEAVGLSVEPIKYYLDNLPNKKNVKKVNYAISDYDGKINIYYVSEENIVKHGLPNFVRGCNSIGKPHPITKGFVFGLNISDEIINVDEVPVKTFKSLVEEFDIEGVDYLKIDTEGHDCIILNNYLDFCEKNLNILAKKILFESNQLADKEEVQKLINRFINLGYKLITTGGENTILEKL